MEAWLDAHVAEVFKYANPPGDARVTRLRESYSDMWQEHWANYLKDRYLRLVRPWPGKSPREMHTQIVFLLMTACVEDFQFVKACRAYAAGHESDADYLARHAAGERHWADEHHGKHRDEHAEHDDDADSQGSVDHW